MYDRKQYTICDHSTEIDELQYLREKNRFKTEIMKLIPENISLGNNEMKELCSRYRTVWSAIWEIFSEFLIFCNLFHEPLGE